MKIHSPHFKKQYDLQKAQLIGQGNFAQVFRIFDNEMNESLAIRRVKKSQSDMQDILKEKVINQQLKKVQNQNILKIYDIIDTSEAVWYITEYCSGGSLWDVLNVCKDNKMNEKDCLQCVLQISKGVQQLHNHRITHRDLKPQNILLKNKYIANKPLPLIKLADFGLSTQKIIMQTIAGTKQYIAPQQAKFHNYTNAVDVWSLGIICDEILHGTPFYTGENNKQVFNKILKMPYKVRDESIRSSIQNFLMSLLKKKPYERPIIAVIRKNIETILEEIDTQFVQKNQEKQKKKEKDKQKQQNIHNNNSSLNKSTKKSGQQNKKIQIKRSKDSIKQSELEAPIKKLQNQVNLNNPRQEKKRQVSNKKAEIKVPELKRQQKSVEEKKNKSSPQKLIQNKSQLFSELKFEEKKDQDFEKQDYNEKTQRSLFKSQKSQVSILMKSSQNSQFTVYKPERKKIGNPAVKQDMIKIQKTDIKQYLDKLAIKKRQLIQKSVQIKLSEKSPSFLPNTSLSSSQFTVNLQNTSEVIKQFKKDYDLLNFVQSSDDYDVKIYRKHKQLKKNKQKYVEKLDAVKQKLKEQFKKQIDNYIESFVQKSLK